ncbi:MAG: thioredoxin fold domain-containing protein [Bacteroidetes bacterium]|nr:thioredoxin fold domain-containing protein [Bacteroidota bacterium]MDA1335838.1 thioredoxin fold domain-containing protein [Bacteroidota bacterium]
MMFRFLLSTCAFFILTIGAMNAQYTGVNWMSLEEAVAAQKKEPRPIMMDVYTQWCGPCKMMMRNTFTSDDVIAYVNKNYYAVKFDAESNGTVSYQGKTYSNPNWNPNANGRNSPHELSRALGVNAYPTLVYFDPEGRVITPIPGYKTPAQLELYLKFFAFEYESGLQQAEIQSRWDAFQGSFQPSFQ